MNYSVLVLIKCQNLYKIWTWMFISDGKFDKRIVVSSKVVLLLTSIDSYSILPNKSPYNYRCMVRRISNLKLLEFSINVLLRIKIWIFKKYCNSTLKHIIKYLITALLNSLNIFYHAHTTILWGQIYFQSEKQKQGHKGNILILFLTHTLFFLAFLSPKLSWLAYATAHKK